MLAGGLLTSVRVSLYTLVDSAASIVNSHDYYGPALQGLFVGSDSVADASIF